MTKIILLPFFCYYVKNQLDLQHILIPTDFSENAWNALEYGVKLFQKTQCTFYLVHIIPISAYSGAGSDIIKARGKLADSSLE